MIKKTLSLLWIKPLFSAGLIIGFTIGCASPGVLTSDLPSWAERRGVSDLEPNVIATLREATELQASELLHDGVCAQCHERQASEYARATMRYGFFSPTFNALELSLNQLSGGRFAHIRSPESSLSGDEREDDAGGDPQAFCSECHGPIAISRGLEVSDQRPSREGGSPREASEGGIGCDVCHTAQTRRAPSEGLKLTPSSLKLGAHHDPAPNGFHEVITPEEARESGSSELSSSEFCAPCHDVRPRRPDVERGTATLRSEDLFSEWARSPWADPDHPQNPLRGVTGITGIHDRPEVTQRGEQITCQDCHMSLYPQRRLNDIITHQEHFTGVDPAELNRKAHKLYPAGRIAEHGHLSQSDRARSRRVATHYFSGVSHPLVPFDPDAIFEVTDPTSSDASSRSWRDEQAISVAQRLEEWSSWRDRETGQRGEWGELRSTHERRAELLRAALTLSLDEIPSEATRGESLRLDAWIENTGAGHNVPAGFSQEREVWVALTLQDQGRACVSDQECQMFTEPPRFLNDPNRYCVVHGPQGERDPALPESGAWEEAARAERSGICGAEGYCVLYRSGYLIDQDGDGSLHDEDLRHVLIERDDDSFEERCVLPGPDADTRLRGVERGLVHFTNALQRVEVDERGAPVEHPGVSLFIPTATPFDPLDLSAIPIALQVPEARRSEYPTQRALYEQSRYRPAPVITAGGDRYGLGLVTPTLLTANRAFNGNALRPFEPRLARYDVMIPPEVTGPLKVDISVRFRFFSPRLLRTLAARHPDLIHESMIDLGLEIIEMATQSQMIQLTP